ncbi:esterase OVCA2 [Diachasma alloeum]|uniref:esterase OVCA2 n=1 Tax=Diachasma alloeum TaxID=454923 RepID=UPI0007383F1F|nr:esterase OVCA2 [Diachasma alloeum]XP_015121357.1 esterase OVCA2 [Diachasma alloeum]
MSAENRKIRILAIHGYYQSGPIFRSKLGSLRKGFKKINFVFAEAPHEVPPGQFANDGEEAVGGKGWWFNTESHYFRATEPSNLSVGYEESLAYIEKVFQKEGPFDGILGFSQGASFVSILCALQQKKLSPINFKFAILISGFKSLCAPHAKFYDEPIDLPTLHVFGESDKIIPTEMAKDLSDLFTNKKLMIHEGGHYVPSKKHIYQDFLNEMHANSS